MAAVTFTEAGKVCTGFSLPYVALYANSGSTVTYSSGQKLARGVNVTIEPNEVTDDNIFYADNAAAESERGTFTGATTTLTVDGLLPAAEALIMGLGSADSDGGYEYNDNQAIPYVGIGFVARYRSGGDDSFTPIVLYKNSFSPIGTSAATQEEQIDWQTQELTANTLRSDAADHPWKYVGASYATEAEAEAIIKTKLSIT